jgi:hypothetical protein
LAGFISSLEFASAIRSLIHESEVIFDGPKHENPTTLGWVYFFGEPPTRDF